MHKYIQDAGYDGPLCLSCNNTQLLAALKPFHDGVTLVGNIGNPIEIAAIDSLKAILADPRVTQATKVSYCSNSTTFN